MSSMAPLSNRRPLSRLCPPIPIYPLCCPGMACVCRYAASRPRCRFPHLVCCCSLPTIREQEAGTNRPQQRSLKRQITKKSIFCALYLFFCSCCSHPAPLVWLFLTIRLRTGSWPERRLVRSGALQGPPAPREGHCPSRTRPASRYRDSRNHGCKAPVAQGVDQTGTPSVRAAKSVYEMMRLVWRHRLSSLMEVFCPLRRSGLFQGRYSFFYGVVAPASCTRFFSYP